MIPYNIQKRGKALLAAVFLAYPLTAVTPALAGKLPATGQTTSFQADKNDGIPGPVNVPDDGTLQRGATLNYNVQKDGTVKDLNTGLIWEMKCNSCGGLHDVSNTYLWSGNGSQETIWDWLDDINTEGGTGYAGHNDWRIPNIRELQSIADYGMRNPSIDAILGPTANTHHWSSTTFLGNTSVAWDVDFGDGFVTNLDKSITVGVRAVRGGPK